MNNWLRATTCVLIATLSLGAAQAASISGDLLITGEVIPSPGPDLSTADALLMPMPFLITDSSGDFLDVGLTFGGFGAISSFTPAMLPVNDLIVVGPFTFALQSVALLEQEPAFLNLVGQGTLSAPGFEDTLAAFSFSADGAGRRFVYSATLSTDVTVVPLPGALLLFVSGLLTLGARRRR